MEFSRAEYRAPITAPSVSMKHPEFALSVAVVDTRRVLRARETPIVCLVAHLCSPCINVKNIFLHF
jgi:hypothetical protein